MLGTRWPAFLGLVVGTAHLTSTVPSTFALDKPIYSAIVCLITLATVLFALARFLPKGDTPTHKGQYVAVALEETRYNNAPRDHSRDRTEHVVQPTNLRRLRALFLVLVLAICLRVELVRQIILNVQCARPTWEPMLPLALAFWDYATLRRRRRHDVEVDEQTSTMYEVWECRIMNSPYRYLAAVAITCFGSLGAMRALRSSPSTHICAASLPYSWSIPYAQHTGTALDALIVLCISGLVYTEDEHTSRGPSTRFSAIGWVCLLSASILSSAVCIFYFASDPEDRYKMLMMSNTLFWSSMRLDVVVCLTAVSALFCTYFVGGLTTALIAMFVSVASRTTSFAYAHTLPFPLGYPGLALLAFVLAAVGFTFYLHMGLTSEADEQKVRQLTFQKAPAWLYLAMLCLLLLKACLWAVHSSNVGHHPIDRLMWEADTHHEAYVAQASASTNLKDAVRNYRKRYSRHPPPGFDHWYRYATDRGSLVIDDFDSVDRDLLPYYALTPEDIRERTWLMIANPWNDASGISIRNGKAAISPNVMPTHRWMLDGIVDMISHFAEWLPDMDLAFNMNDECRIAVHYDEIESMRETGRRSGDISRPVENIFTPNRGGEWRAFTEEGYSESPLKHRSFQRTFSEFGSAGCPPESPARAKRHWDTSSICTSCTAPHSLGAFLANWTTAADVCHQPDLADLHGLYLSPAAFKGANDLFPIFSQSKAHGFNDILYPSAWNYMDKVRYDPNDEFPDPPFQHKNSTLFWRGATSEGVSPGHGQWRGMTRQRFVHLTSPKAGSNHAPQPILIPSGSHKHTYTTLPVSDLAALLPTSVHITETIHRCGGPDCDDELAEFSPLATPTDFQSHWSYKYLLDLDGAGFSGRFLPFLASRSLPLKSALFREWWDDRLTPWLHFAPLDLRGQGLWATLAYFAGFEGVVGGKRMKVAGHEKEGERIAMAGREWAGQVLRKEDMEIYFFRLLLEWGRLTDDRRDGIGFGSGMV